MMKNLSLGFFFFVFGVLASAKTPNQIEREAGLYTGPIFARVFDPIASVGLETPIQIRCFLYLNLAVWNAWSNYHPTAIDIFGRSRFKRPKSEHTLRNKNIATMFSLYRVYQASPATCGGDSKLSEFRKIIEEQGFDPDDKSMDTTTPVGIGNREGNDTATLLIMDGWNSEGDLTASVENYKLPFQDYTGYTPLNSPWRLTFPFKWQPVLETDKKGFFFRQEHVTPQAGNSIAFSITPDQLNRRRVSNPYVKSFAKAGFELPADLNKLKYNARQVLKTSAALNEKRQLLAELFDNKIKAFQNERNPAGVLGIAAAIRFGVLPLPLDWSYDDDVIYGIAANIASYDATVVAWKEKRRIDAIRPTGQTMEYLFGNQKFSVWGGPGKSPAKLKAGNWQPYIRTMPHSEFPSASACLCTALIEHALIVTKGRNYFPYTFTIPKGVSSFYPGEIPSSNVSITINRLTDWASLCGTSRLWAGVHFKPAVPAGKHLCRGLGKKAQYVTDELLEGKGTGTWLNWFPKNAKRFWEE